MSMYVRKFQINMNLVHIIQCIFQFCCIEPIYAYKFNNWLNSYRTYIRYIIRMNMSEFTKLCNQYLNSYTHAHTFIYIQMRIFIKHTHTHIYIYIYYIYIYLYICIYI